MQHLLTSDQLLAQVARDLGMAAWCLRDWKKRLTPHLAQQLETLKALRRRVAELEQDNLRLRQRRDILKKTLGIVSTT